MVCIDGTRRRDLNSCGIVYYLRQWNMLFVADYRHAPNVTLRYNFVCAMYCALGLLCTLVLKHDRTSDCLYLLLFLLCIHVPKSSESATTNTSDCLLAGQLLVQRSTPQAFDRRGCYRSSCHRYGKRTFRTASGVVVDWLSTFTGARHAA